MDQKGLIIHFDFLSKNQQVVSCEMAVHTQQQNPHRDQLYYFNMVMSQRLNLYSRQDLRM
jgi:hypothetical protein